jgi:sigma-B regulation protein RsbU (phosphoserine phosphatase)
MPKINTLQQRFVVYMVLPVALLLFVMGTIGFIFARGAILQQWEEAALLKLQRAAHHVDMRLAQPKEWVSWYLKFVEEHQHTLAKRLEILTALEQSDGILAVHLKGGVSSPAPVPHSHSEAGGGRMGPGRRMGPSSGPMRRGHAFTVTEPRYNPDTDHRTVSLITRAVNETNGNAFEIEVVMDFDYLLRDMPFARWWQSQKTFLVDGNGHIFVSTTAVERRRLGETGDPVETSVLAAIAEKASGTLRGRGHPPEEIGGFYRLEEAPWYIAVFAPGEEILKPIVRFRNYYFLTLAAFVFIILLLIRSITGRVAQAVNRLSAAAGDIAQGKFDLALPERSPDEIGALTRSFNTMAAQLKERLHLRQSLDLAKEVQQNLLPSRTPRMDGLDIAGRSIYCEETGGDYFDYLSAQDALHVVVGDVAGHGISAALLMSSVRANLRQCYCHLDDIAGQVTDLNRNVTTDVGESGRFVTLFYLSVVPKERRIRWVRAGHDPGLIYRAKDDRFEALGGPGIALGLDAEWTYEVQETKGLQAGDIILVGTDGIWEARNCDGIMFGKARLEAIIRAHREAPAETILAAVFDTVNAHACETKLADDITLIVVKIIS